MTGQNSSIPSSHYREKGVKIPSSLCEGIRAYAGEGYAVFPTNGKKPLPGLKWVEESKVDTAPTALNYPHGQFGVKLKADDLIIDLDPRNMEGRKVWQELKEKVPVLQRIEKTATVVKTGGGGLHIYLRKPVDFMIKKSLPEYPGIEFLTKGAYIIGAGSTHESSNNYTFIYPPFEKPVQAPGALLSLLKKDVRDIGIDRATHPGFTNKPELIEKYVDYRKNHAPLAIEGKNGDQTTYTVACKGRDFNLSIHKTLSLMLQHYNIRCSPPWSDQELGIKVRNAYNYAAMPAGIQDPEVVFNGLSVGDPNINFMDRLEKFPKGGYRPTFFNAVLLLKNEVSMQGKFSLNEFTEQLEVIGVVPWEKDRINTYRQINDREIEMMRFFFADKFGGVDFSTQNLWKAVDIVSAGSRHHPVREHVESLKWDGVSRVDSWLIDYCGVPDIPLYRVMGRKVLVAMITRLYEPGCKWDFVLVLEGRQGIGKSTICRLLGGQWYGDAPLDAKDKDSVPYIHSHWVIELSEMITARKSESDRMKNFISRTEDDVRLPYARCRTKYPRQCVFIGTINPDETGYLSDTTGNRRYWPVLCDKIDYFGFDKIRDRLIAEALVCYQAGETLYLPPDLAKQAEEQAGLRLANDPWFGPISDYSIGKERECLTVQDVYTDVLGGSIRNMHVGHARRIGDVFKKLGWVKRQRADGMVFIKPERVEVKDPFEGVFSENN
jgi:hypothetical protein